MLADNRLMQISPLFQTKPRPQIVWHKHAGEFRHYKYELRLVPCGRYWNVCFYDAGKWWLATTPAGTPRMTWHTARQIAGTVIRKVFEAEATV